MNNEKDISEDGESTGNYSEINTPADLSETKKKTEEKSYREEKKQEEKEETIETMIHDEFPEKQRRTIKDILKKVIRRKIGREEIVQYLSHDGIDPHAYNRLIRRVISKASAEMNRKKESIGQKEECKTLRIKGVLKEQFLLEIKKDIEDSSYITKTQQQYSFFKRTPEDLSSIVSSRPHLISLFSANYNVLCCKIKKILSVKDLHNKLKKGSFEYKLNEQVSIETAKCAYAVTIHYIKEIVGKCLDIDGNLDRNLLIKTMFGNVRGVYLLYSDYPPVKCFHSFSG